MTAIRRTRVNDFLRLLGYEPNHVAWIEIRPARVIVNRVLRNHDGSFMIDDLGVPKTMECHHIIED